MVKNIANATERSDLHHRLVYSAVKAANSKSISEVEHCFDILRYLKNMKLSIKEICESEAIHVLESMRHHKNPKIRTEVEVLFDSWRKTLYSGGRDTSTCNKALPLNVKKPRTRADKVGVIKQTLKKQPPVKVSKNPKDCPALRKNATEMLELFEIAKKSADVANAKGLLAAKKETSICVDTLSLLISYPISSTANETRQIMEKLERLTKHKDRKICSSGSALLQHWRQSIRDQQHEDSRKIQG